jgi:hypothetical protein
MRKLLAVLTVSLFALAACGGGDDSGGGGLSGEEKDFVDSAMKDFDAKEAEPLTEDQARCIVEGMVTGMGVDRLDEIGITPETFSSEGDSPFPSGLTDDEADKVIKSFDSCFDLEELFLEASLSDASLTDEAKKCLTDAIDSDTIHKVFKVMLTEGEDALGNDPELTQALLALFTACPDALGG